MIVTRSMVDRRVVTRLQEVQDRDYTAPYASIIQFCKANPAYELVFHLAYCLFPMRQSSFTYLCYLSIVLHIARRYIAESDISCYCLLSATSEHDRDCKK